MLDSHPSLAIPPESHFIPKLARQRPRYERDDRFDTSAFLADLFENNRYQRWELPASEVRRALDAGRASTYPEAIRAVYSLYAARAGKPRYGDKTPGYVRHLPVLADLFPEARFVYIIRDGRDVALSLLDVEWGPTTLEKAARRWRKYVEAGLAAGQTLGPGRYLEVRYEELVAHPEATLRRLCSFVGLSYDVAMLRYHQHAAELLSAAVYPDNHAHILLPPIAGLRDWRQQMSDDQVRIFEGTAGDILASLGYERVT
jgi:hypothetical protein